MVLFRDQIKSSLYLRYYVIPSKRAASLGPISAVQRLDNTAAKKRRSGGEPWRHCVRFDRSGNRTHPIAMFLTLSPSGW